MDMQGVICKLEEIRCCIIDVESAIEKLAAQTLRNAATEAGHDAGQPQQPLCASGKAKLPTLDECFAHVAGDGHLNGIERLCIKETYDFLVGNFTKR